MPPTDEHRRPGALLWLFAAASILLPIVGVVAALYGLIFALQGHSLGYAWLLAGLVILVADLFIDTRWKHWIGSSEPDLNRRGDQLIGQIVTVVEPIAGGARGSVRVGDSVWVAEGMDAPPGAKVRVTACSGTVLSVEPV